MRCLLQGLALAVLVLAAVLPTPAPPAAGGFVVRGTVDCGRPSGLPCLYGPNLTLVTDDLGTDNQQIVINVLAILGALG
jgi:hypothetical protein